MKIKPQTITTTISPEQHNYIITNKLTAYGLIINLSQSLKVKTSPNYCHTPH